MPKFSYDIDPRLKYEIKRKYHFTCQCCHSKGKDVRLEIHHRNFLPGVDAIDNLIPICHNCHELFHKDPQKYIREYPEVFLPPQN